MTKFIAGDNTDISLCITIKHEFMRCEDSFKQFTHYAEILIIKGQTREISYKTYNAYADFIHHLYEFLQACHVRDVNNTEITNKKGEERLAVIDGYVTFHTQRIFNNHYESIKNGQAPVWLNDIDYYEVEIPTDFAKDFREYRNKVAGHATHERISKLNLSEFYNKYHKFLFYLYQDSIYWWRDKGADFPDLKDVTEFSVLIKKLG